MEGQWEFCHPTDCCVTAIKMQERISEFFDLKLQRIIIHMDFIPFNVSSRRPINTSEEMTFGASRSRSFLFI